MLLTFLQDYVYVKNGIKTDIVYKKDVTANIQNEMLARYLVRKKIAVEVI